MSAVTKYQKKTSYRKRLQEFVDQDYWNKLNPQEQKWLDTFNKTEYANDRPRRKQTDSHIEANYVHSKEDIKRLDDANNARNRDLYSRLKVTGQISDITHFEEELEPNTNTGSEWNLDGVLEVYDESGYDDAVKALYLLVEDRIYSNPTPATIKNALCRFHVEIKRLERKNKRSKTKS